MKEKVHETKHPWLVGAVMAAIGITYLVLLGQSGFQEPAQSFEYNSEQYRELDNIETNYDEVAQLDPKLTEPRAMTIAPDGRLFVAGENEVAVFKNDAEVSRFPIAGQAKCMDVSEDGAVYVGYNGHVAVYDQQGTMTAEWPALAGQPYITAVASTEEFVYVGDAGNKVVVQYDHDGNILREIGRKDEDEDIPGIEVPSPYLDLGVNQEGHLWVVNPGLLGFERYRSDGSLVTSWYRATLQLEGFSGCCNPTQMAFAPDGTLVTAEKGLVRIKTYDVTDGEYQELVAGSKLFPREQSLRDIAVDQAGRILALDPRTDTVRIFQHKESTDGQRS